MCTHVCVCVTHAEWVKRYPCLLRKSQGRKDSEAAGLVWSCSDAIDANGEGAGSLGFQFRFPVLTIIGKQCREPPPQTGGGVLAL